MYLYMAFLFVSAKRGRFQEEFKSYFPLIDKHAGKVPIILVITNIEIEIFTKYNITSKSVEQINEEDEIKFLTNYVPSSPKTGKPYTDTFVCGKYFTPNQMQRVKSHLRASSSLGQLNGPVSPSALVSPLLPLNSNTQKPHVVSKTIDSKSNNTFQEPKEINVSISLNEEKKVDVKIEKTSIQSLINFCINKFEIINYVEGIYFKEKIRNFSSEAYLRINTDSDVMELRAGDSLVVRTKSLI